MNFYGLLIGILCVWRITHLLYGEDGPLDLFLRWRRWVGAGFWGSLLDCFYCLSLWVSVPFAWLIGHGWLERVLLWPALSAGAILLERCSTHTQPPVYFEENENVMLRQGQSGSAGDPSRPPQS